jgi:hypothetical protein
MLALNLIENLLRNWREATGNVKRWNEKEDIDTALDGERAAVGGSGVPQDSARGRPPPADGDMPLVARAKHDQFA